MGTYNHRISSDRDRPEIAFVKDAKSYTLYLRSPFWYVNFRAGGRQYRVSLALSDYEEARALVESYRATGVFKPREYSDKHLYRIIERARCRATAKNIPFSLSIDMLRQMVANGGGCCAITGHILEESGPFRPSLDRITPALGYVPGNVRIVCLITNTAMLHYGEAALAELAISYCSNRKLIAA